MVVKVEISQGGKKVTADAVVTVEQPTYPVGAPIPDVGLVELSTFNPTELIPGPRGSLWFTGSGAPTLVDMSEGDMYLDDATDQVWRWTSGAWINTGTDITGQQGPPGVDGSPDTPAQILAKLVTVDGAGSGLDADTLDGLDSLYFASAASLATETTNRTNADTALQTNINGKVAKAGDTMTGGLVTVASATGGAGLNLPHGAAPSAPVNGDIWTTTTNLSWRQNGATYNAMNLNGAQQVSGVKTFTAEPIMPVPAAGGASIRLPHGVAPSAPVDGDLWTTSAGMYVRVSGGTVGPIGAPPDLSAYAPLASPTFTGDPKAPTPATADNDTSIATTAYVKNVVAALPPSGIPEAPNDGQQYARQSLAWAAVAIPPSTSMADAPPASPQPGQLWYETDTGALYIWFNDGTSSQWIQIAGPTTAPEIAPMAQCYLTTSGANLLLQRENGNKLLINGRNETIPAAGVTLAPTGLAAATTYWIYAAMVAGVMVLEASTTAPAAADATYGFRFKTGDASRTFVGGWRSAAAGAWDADRCRGASWFNPKAKSSFAGNISPSTASCQPNPRPRDSGGTYSARSARWPPSASP